MWMKSNGYYISEERFLGTGGVMDVCIGIKAWSRFS